MVLVVEDLDALLGSLDLFAVGHPLRTDAAEEGTQGDRNPRQWRMLRLPGIDSLVEPFHSAGDVARLVNCMAKHRVGSRDAKGSDDSESQGQHSTPALQEGRKTIGRPMRDGALLPRAACL